MHQKITVLLGIPETNFSGRSTRTARNVLRSTDPPPSLPDGVNGSIVTTLQNQEKNSEKLII